MRLEFTSVCETGIELIDREHKQFFEYINAAYDALERDDDEAVLIAKNILKKLRDYTDYHFHDEEEYMKEHKDAELVRQIREHENFCKAIDEMIKGGVDTKSEIEKIVSFLTKWLYRHILTSDTLIGKAERKSHRFELTKDFLTGIKLIDDEHAQLFSIINRGWDVLEDDLVFDKYDKIIAILNELKLYTQRHFADEEEYMLNIKYEGYDAQKKLHDAFIDRVVNLDLDELDNADDDQNGYLVELLDFLNDWLINHILRMDKKIPQK